jgi:hypothetical protein
MNLELVKKSNKAEIRRLKAELKSMLPGFNCPKDDFGPLQDMHVQLRDEYYEIQCILAMEEGLPVEEVRRIPYIYVQGILDRQAERIVRCQEEDKRCSTPEMMHKLSLMESALRKISECEANGNYSKYPKDDS